MKKVLMVLLVLLCTVSWAAAAELKVGDKVAPFSLKNFEDKEFSLASPIFAGKVVLIYYTVGESKEVRDPIAAAKLDPKAYIDLAILNMKDVSYPRFAVKGAVLKSDKATGKPTLVDDKYVLLNAWGLSHKAVNIVVVDKNGVCRYIFRGKDLTVPPAEIGKFIAVIKEYEAK